MPCRILHLHIKNPMLHQTAPPAFPITNPPLPEYQTQTLPNGVKVYSVTDTAAEVVKISMYFNAGVKNNLIPFLAGTTTSLWKQGTHRLSGSAFSAAIDGYGAYLSVTAGTEFTEISIHTLNRCFAEVMNLVLEMIQTPAFNETDLRIDCTNRKQRLTTELQKTSYTAITNFNVAMMGENHPLAFIAPPEDAEKITRDDVVSFYNNFLLNGLMSVLVAGYVTPEMDNWFADNLGSFNTSPTRSIGAIETTPTGKKKVFIPHQTATQSSIVIGRPLFSRFHPDFASMRVVTVLFGGYFGSRLMSNLREDKGYTYGISASMNVNYSSGQLIIRTDVGTEVTADAIAEINKELLRMCTEEVRPDELELVKNYMLGTYLRSVDGALAKADVLSRLLNYGLTTDALKVNIEALKSLTPSKIKTFSEKYFQPQDMTVVVSGSKDV